MYHTCWGAAMVRISQFLEGHPRWWWVRLNLVANVIDWHRTAMLISIHIFCSSISRESTPCLYIINDTWVICLVSCSLYYIPPFLGLNHISKIKVECNINEWRFLHWNFWLRHVLIKVKQQNESHVKVIEVFSSVKIKTVSHCCITQQYTLCVTAHYTWSSFNFETLPHVLSECSINKHTHVYSLYLAWWTWRTKIKHITNDIYVIIR